MRISVCVGNYATTPYYINGLEVRVYCMEELCYCLRENAFLLDLSLLNESLVEWIDRECGVQELAQELYPMVRKQGSLSAFVTLILEYVGLYDGNTVREVERVLKEGSGLSSIEKRKKQIDYLVRKRKYTAAIRGYDGLLSCWQEEAEHGMEVPKGKVKADILHNKGVTMAYMMEYKDAADCFKKAYELEPSVEHYRSYLAAKRMELTDEAYLAFVAEQPDSYELSLQLESEIENLRNTFREQESGVKLDVLKSQRAGGDKQRYYMELEQLALVLKDNYRNSMSE